MTWKPRDQRDAAEADRRANARDMGRCGHGASCQCIRNIGRDAYVMETERWRAENDAKGYESPPRGRWMRRI